MTRGRSRQRKPAPPERIAAKLATLRTSDDAETRYAAAHWLGDHGDATVLEPLETAVLHDDGSFSKEGAFVDSFVSVAGAAQDALRSLYKRIELTPADEERLLALFRHGIDDDPPTDDALYILHALGRKAEPLARRVLDDAHPVVRLRAHLVPRWFEGGLTSDLWAVDDEPVRFELTRRHVGLDFVQQALAHFPHETSARVRLGIAEQWLRYEKRMGGALRERDLVLLLSDDDPRVRACALAVTGDRHRLREIYPLARIDELVEAARARS